jgi:hypothetical protein
MTDPDRLEADWERVCEELRNAKVANANLGDRLNLKIDEQRAADAELLRLRGLLARLEWAGQRGDGYGPLPDPACPVCESVRSRGKDHAPGCWLAAELHP